MSSLDAPGPVHKDQITTRVSGRLSETIADSFNALLLLGRGHPYLRQCSD